MDMPSTVLQMLKAGIEEDIGHGDITTTLLIHDETSVSRARFVAKGNFVLAGMPFAKEIFHMLDPETSFHVFFPEGSRIRKGDMLAEVSGKTRVLFAGERVSLNILQRTSGIATLTSRFVEEVKGTKAKILDTRKTTPCMRFVEKYAVRMGGGTNHRFGLFDGILIKDNHIEAVGSIKEAVARAKEGYHLARIEVEVENLKDFEDAIEAGADIIMLDNMTVEDMRKAVKLGRGRVQTEASGNIRLRNVRQIAETGVDMISIGGLTHSALAADISMKIIA